LKWPENGHFAALRAVSRPAFRAAFEALGRLLQRQAIRFPAL